MQYLAMVALVFAGAFIFSKGLTHYTEMRALNKLDKMLDELSAKVDRLAEKEIAQ